MIKVDVSIITVNYNNLQLTRKFLTTLTDFFPKTYSYEIIIVDNNSSKDNIFELEKDFKDSEIILKIVRSNINLGFGGGNMLGNQFATGTYVAFINNDVEFYEDCFTSLIQFLEKNANVGVCSPHQYSMNLEPVIGFDYFQGLRKELFGRSFIEKQRKNGTPKRKQLPYKENFEVEALQGCFMFFRAESFALIGGFDTNLFLYFEEMDLCLRLSNNNLKSFIVPQTGFKHHVSATVKQNPLMKRELMISRLYTYRKHYSFMKYKLLQLIIILKLLPKTLTSKSNWQLFTIVYKGAPLSFSLKQLQKMNYSSKDR
ncbi:MAG: glycosyltransferase family 2 protein [Aquaticitalea sp.]